MRYFFVATILSTFLLHVVSKWQKKNNIKVGSYPQPVAVREAPHFGAIYVLTPESITASCDKLVMRIKARELKEK